MFSVRTTGGSLSIVLMDAAICFLPFQAALRSPLSVFRDVSLTGWQGYSVPIVCTLLIVASLAVARLYSFMEYVYPVDLVKRIVPASVLSLGSIATFGFLRMDVMNFSARLLVPLLPIFLFLFLVRYLIFYAWPENRERVLIIGANDQTREIIQESKSRRLKGYDIVGVITSLENVPGRDFQGMPILGKVEDLLPIVRDNKVDRIVITLRDRRGKLPVHPLLACKVKKIRVQEGSSFCEQLKRKIVIDEYLKPSWFVFEDGFFQTSLHNSIKRLQGILVSLMLLAVMSPVLLVVALLIKLESRGPIFYRQERVGLNGKVFNLLKFRSMYQDAEKMSGPVFAQKKDPRVTFVGRIIRKTRLDEFPQLINILRGDMDMVGPRPERPFFVRQLSDVVPYYDLRHTVRPGLTGWAQVRYPYGDNLNDSKEKLQYDLYYVKHLSWYFDLLIIFLTFREVIHGGGR